MLRSGTSARCDVSLIWISVCGFKCFIDHKRQWTLKCSASLLWHQVLPDVSDWVSWPWCPPGSCPDQWLVAELVTGGRGPPPVTETPATLTRAQTRETRVSGSGPALTPAPVTLAPRSNRLTGLRPAWDNMGGSGKGLLKRRLTFPPKALFVKH